MGNNQTINYKLLLRDFIIVNVTAGLAVFLMLTVMMLQNKGVLPSFPCTIHELFHMYCPGCGGTRAILALLKGEILHSIAYNPAILLGGLLMMYYEVGVIVTLIKKNQRYYFYRKNGLVMAYLMIVLVFAVVRDCLLVGLRVDLLQDFIR